MNGLLLAIVLAATTRQNVDHIMIGVPNLETGMAAFEKATGVKPVRGGVHPGRGTQNALVSLGDGTYLELIAPQAQPDAMTDRVKELRSLTSATLLTWAERISDVSAARKKLESAGFTLTPPMPGARNTPAGGHLQWTTFEIATPKIDAAPFFINWKTQQHPSKTSPSECTMRTFEIADPKAAALNDLLRVTGMSLRAKRADATRMRLVLQCGARTVEFTNK